MFFFFFKLSSNPNMITMASLELSRHRLRFEKYRNEADIDGQFEQFHLGTNITETSE